MYQGNFGYAWYGYELTGASTMVRSWNGKVDWYDYGARYYDPLIGMFLSVDPLSENSYSVNPYAFYPRGMRPQSYVQKTSMTYRGNGTRQMVGMGPQTILNTVNTPGGNEVQMSNNNELGMGISGGIDFLNSYKDFKELLISLVSTVRYGEDGNVQNSTEILIDDPQLAMQQLDYEMKAREIEKGLGEVDFTGKSLVESLEMLAERKKIIQDKIGISPKEVIQTELFLHPERFRFGTSTRRILPELIQH